MNSIYLFNIIFFISCSGHQSPEASARPFLNPDKEVICFVYHRFGDSRYPSTNISLGDFEAHLAYLVKNKFQVLTLSAAIAYLKSSEPARKTVVITVDDGYKSFFKNGLPLLKKYGLPATLFINTETVGGGDYMDWEELRVATKGKLEIGNHTHTHGHFLNESEFSRYRSFKEEIALSQSLIRNHLDIEARVFSYPYGEFDERMQSEVKNAGFTGAVAQNSGVIHEGTNLYQCPRFPMSESYATLDKFVEKVSVRALKVVHSSATNFSLTEDKRPKLMLTIDGTNLRLQELQCFVQGGECIIRILDKKDMTVSISLQASKPILGRRRTLYTVTVPDKDGKWHWYSHLWINEKVR